MYALMPWMQRYRIFTEHTLSKKSGMDISITEDDFSAMRLDKVSEKTTERSSFLVTPALLKSNSRSSFGTFSTLWSNLNSVRTENEILQNKVEELEASKKQVDAENVALRKKVEELELLCRRENGKESDADVPSGGEPFTVNPLKWFMS